MLAAGPHQPRGTYDFSALEAERPGDVDLSEIGRDAAMPWQANGRRWHTQDRVGHNGQACRWDGRVLERVVDQIQELGEFSDTDWNDRSRVEIRGDRKSDGWFFHALTGEQWLVKLKFRVAKNTFNRDEIVAQLGLKPLNDLPDLPVYGREPRVKCQNLRGPWQEIQLQVHTLEEIDKPAFWKFLARAVEGFQKFSDRARQNPDDVMPWKVLGQKWHFSRKGFPPGKPPAWSGDLLEELCEALGTAAPNGQFLWNNQQVVHVFVPGQNEPWASLFTKRQAGLDLLLTGPKGRFALGRLTGLAADREFLAGPQLDVIKLRFIEQEDLERGDLATLLREHVDSLTTTARGIALAAGE